MEFIIARRFYSNIKANIYYLKLSESGINCFLANENISTILPLSDGGVILHVAKNQIKEAREIILNIDTAYEKKDEEDFRDATLSDITYEKELNEYEKWLDSGPVNKSNIFKYLIVALIVVLITIIVNYFFPFIK